MSRWLWVLAVMMIIVGAGEDVRAQPPPLTPIAIYGMGEPHQAAFSVDGTRLAVAMGMGGVRIYDTADLTAPLNVLGAPKSSALDVAFSADNSRLAVGYANGSLGVYDGATFDEITLFTGYTDSVVAVAFTPDGQRVIGGSWDMTARVWDIQTRQAVHNFRLESWGTALAVSPDGGWLAVGNRGAHLFDLTTGKQVALLNTHTDIITSLAFSPDSTLLATGSADASIKLWEVASATEQAALFPHDGGVVGLWFDPQTPTQVLSSTQDSSIYRWDIQTQHILQRERTLSPLIDLSPRPRSGWLAASPELGVVELDETLTTHPVPQDIRSAITAIAPAPEGEILVGYHGGEIELLNPLDGTSQRIIAADYLQVGGVGDIHSTPDGAYIVVGYQRHIRVYSSADGALVAQVKTPRSLSGLVVDGQGGRVASVGSALALYQLPDLTPITGFEFTRPVKTAAFSPDGTRLAIGERTGEVRIFDAETYAALPFTITAPSKPEFGDVTAVATDLSFSPDGEALFISWNHYVSGVYSPQTGAVMVESDLKEVVAQVMVYPPTADYVVFLDAREIAFLQREGLVWMGRYTKAYEGSAVDGFFSPDGQTLYTLATDTIIRAWDVGEP